MLSCVYTADSKETWVLFVTAALTGSLILLALWKWGNVSTRTILIIAVLLRLAFIVLPPSLSDDAYRYVWDGVLTADGINPYKFKPSDDQLSGYHAEEMYGVLNSADYYSVYPPVSQLAFAVSGFFYDGTWESSYYIIKLFLSLCEIGALIILARIVSPGMLLLYAWNPVVLIETAGQAHTEALMLLALMICTWATRHKKPVAASVALAFAGWVKLYPFVFFPLLWRRFGWKKGLLPGFITALVLFVPFYHSAFFSNIFESLNLYVRFFEFNAGVYYSVKKAFMIWTGDDWSKTLGPFFRRVFLVGLPVIYLLDARFKWTLPRSFLLISAFFLVCSTTIHPWYFLGILLFITQEKSPRWHWYWLAATSIGTYLLYVDGPYWWFVHVGWWGWLGLALFLYAGQFDVFLQQLQRYRAHEKVRNIEGLVAEGDRGHRVLDLGAGEGYVGAAIQEFWGAGVNLVDVVDMNRTALPHTLYDGNRLPFTDSEFDTTVLYFVLHHTEDAEYVFKEALRVTKGQVVVVESVYTTPWGLRVLTFLDTLANRIRSGGLMKAQEEQLNFKRVPEWKALFKKYDTRVVAEMAKYSLLHKQHFFVVRRSE